MTNALIISTGYDPEYLRIIEQIALNSQSRGFNPVIFDLAPVMSSPVNSHSKLVLKLGRIKSPSDIFKTTMTKMGFEVVDAVIKESGEEQNPDILQELDEAVSSALYTYFRTDKVNFFNKRVVRVRNNLFHEGLRSYWATKYLLSKRSFDVFYIPNGRFPVQRLAKKAISEQSSEIFHFEKGATKDHAYVRPYSPHERVKSQLDVPEVISELTENQIEELAVEWLISRLPSSSSSNQYSTIWKDPVSTNENSENLDKQIGFFTSSQDEFLHLGPEWQLHKWQSQIEAFDFLLSHFEKLNYKCYLRIHPNLVTKNHENFKREIKSFRELQKRHPNAKIYWHDDPTNSYLLIEKSAGIVVWDSTVGLEASARGIPVWNCAASYYGLIADKRDIFGPTDIERMRLTPWQVDKRAAWNFIAYFLKRDIELHNDAQKWTPWNLKNPPLTVKLASLAYSGGAPTFIDSIFASLDPWRHRGARANLQLMKLKLSRKQKS